MAIKAIRVQQGAVRVQDRVRGDFENLLEKTIRYGAGCRRCRTSAIKPFAQARSVQSSVYPCTILHPLHPDRSTGSPINSRRAA